MNIGFKNKLLDITGASGCKELQVIQSLWSGYGTIARYRLDGASLNTVVVKHIALSKVNSHPRGWGSDFGHQRKVRSYQVETHWYQRWSQKCGSNCRLPQFIGSYDEGQDQWIILEDLDTIYPVRKSALNFDEVKVCLKWLANFHAIFLGSFPEGLWPIGTYWHLDTRPDEFEKIENQELKAKAHLIDERLNTCRFKTIVHGDAKLANFCFSEDGLQVAAVDFQYVGGGCGMKDVAYFLGSCLSSQEQERYDAELLNFYFHELSKALELAGSDIDREALESEWRELYPFACVDFIRFMLGWMPTHQKVNGYNLKLMRRLLRQLSDINH